MKAKFLLVSLGCAILSFVFGSATAVASTPKHSQTLSASSSTKSTVSGKSFTVSGKVRPRTGGRVYLQEKVHGHWHNIKSAKSKKKSGRYSYKVKFSTGKHVVRSYKPSSKRYRAGKSRSITIMVRRPGAAALSGGAPATGGSSAPYLVNDGWSPLSYINSQRAKRGWDAVSVGSSNSVPVGCVLRSKCNVTGMQWGGLTSQGDNLTPYIGAEYDVSVTWAKARWPGSGGGWVEAIAFSSFG